MAVSKCFEAFGYNGFSHLVTLRNFFLFVVPISPVSFSLFLYSNDLNTIGQEPLVYYKMNISEVNPLILQVSVWTTLVKEVSKRHATCEVTMQLGKIGRRKMMFPSPLPPAHDGLEKPRIGT